MDKLDEIQRKIDFKIRNNPYYDGNYNLYDDELNKENKDIILEELDNE